MELNSLEKLGDIQGLPHLASTISFQDMEEYIDFEALRREYLEDLSFVWSDDVPIGQGIWNLIDQHFSLPYADVQIPLLAAYWSIPSTLASIAPILFLDGQAGSGKSTLSKIYAHTHGIQPYGVNSTYASLRNDIDNFRFKEVEHQNGYTIKMEQNFCLVFDNLNRETLSNENLLSLFLSGYNRDTANVTISVEIGKNRRFNTFCPKLISSIHNVLDEPKFNELKRRCIRILCKKADKLTDADQANRTGLPPHNAELSSFYWLKTKFSAFWRKHENIAAYGRCMKGLAGQSINVPANRRGIYLDLIASGVISGVFPSLIEAFKTVCAYENELLPRIFQVRSPLGIVLEGFLSSLEERGHYEIDPPLLKSRLSLAIAEGQLESQPSFRSIEEEMFNLGWKRAKKGLGSWAWIRI